MPTPRPSAATASGYVHWTRIDLPDPAPGVFGGSSPSNVLRFAGQYVAVGGVWADCGGVMTDGSRLFAYGVYAPPVTQGETVRYPAVWVSTDALHWSRSAGPAPSLMALGPNGLVGASEVLHPDGSLDTVQFMRSTDGLRWTTTSGSYRFDIRAIAVASDGHAIALGTVPGARLVDGTPTDDTVLYTSPDGTGWTGPTTLFTGADPIALAAVDTGFVALIERLVERPDGTVTNPAALEWIFGSGVHQETAIPTADAEDATFLEVLGSTLVVVGSDDTGAVRIWVATDGGSTFARVPAQAALSGESITITGMLATSSGLLATGERWDSASNHPLPVAWLAQR